MHLRYRFPHSIPNPNTPSTYGSMTWSKYFGEPRTTAPVSDLDQKPKTFSVLLSESVSKTVRPSSWIKGFKSDVSTVKTAVQTGDVRLKYPAAQVISNVVSRFTMPMTAFILNHNLGKDETFSAIVGGIVGDYFGAISAFGLSWYALHIKSLTKGGLAKRTNEIGTFAIRALCGLGIDWVREEQARNSNVSFSQLAIRAVVGTIFSPVPVTYAVYAVTAGVWSVLTSSAVAATVLGDLFMGTFYVAYSNWINQKFLTDMQDSRNV